MSGPAPTRLDFLTEVQEMTANFYTELVQKWRTLYEFTEEVQKKNQDSLLTLLEEFYDEILQQEESNKLQKIAQVEKELKELIQLKKDLNVDDGHSPQKGDNEPYAEFRQRIQDHMKKYEEMKEERLSKLESLREQEKELCDLLEIAPTPKFPNAIPTDQQLEDIEYNIFQLREEKINRGVFFAETRERIMNLARIMEYDVESDFEVEILTTTQETFIPSTTNVEKLKKLKEQFETQYENQISYRSSLLDKLNKLWHRLKIDEDEREAFLRRYPNPSKSHIKAIQDEISRCEELKLANIKPMVQQMREDICKFWDALTYTDEQRKQFPAFFTEHLSEDVLTLHELELDRLQLFYDSYKYIYDLAEKRDELWKRMLHLDEIAMDKTRLFKNRGGQLLKEEKERKSLEVNVPKVDKQLKSALIEFQEKENKPFLWYGNDLLEMISQQWEERQQEKESKKLARKVENQKQNAADAELGTRLMAQKRRLGTPSPGPGEAKSRRRDDLGQTVVLQSDPENTMNEYYPDTLPYITE